MGQSDLELDQALSEPRSKRGALRLLLRVVVGVGVFAFLIARSDVGELWGTIREARPAYVLGAVGVIFTGLFVSALRWQAYLEALELPLPYRTLFRLYFVGTFFNAFLPTGIGGDAYKAVRVGRGRGSLAPAFASVFLDRFAGVVALSAFGFVSSAYLLAGGDVRRGVPLLALALSAGIMGAATLLLWGGERLLGRGRLIRHEGIGGRIRRAVRSIHQAGRHPDAAARGYLFGVVFQALGLTYHVMAARAFGLPVPLAAMACIVVISSVATMIPLSVNGLGFREGAYVWALGRYGVGRPEATAFALLVLAVLLLSSVIGGIVYVISGGEIGDRAGPGAGVESAPTSQAT